MALSSGFCKNIRHVKFLVNIVNPGEVMLRQLFSIYFLHPYSAFYKRILSWKKCLLIICLKLKKNNIKVETDITLRLKFCTTQATFCFRKMQHIYWGSCSKSKSQLSRFLWVVIKQKKNNKVNTSIDKMEPRFSKLLLLGPLMIWSLYGP